MIHSSKIIGSVVFAFCVLHTALADPNFELWNKTARPIKVKVEDANNTPKKVTVLPGRRME